MIRGSYVDFGYNEDPGEETEEFTDQAGRELLPTHWAFVLLDERIPQAPPEI